MKWILSLILLQTILSAPMPPPSTEIVTNGYTLFSPKLTKAWAELTAPLPNQKMSRVSTSAADGPRNAEKNVGCTKDDIDC